MKALMIKGTVSIVDIEDSLRALQHVCPWQTAQFRKRNVQLAVDGHIECITLADGGVMIVNEEGAMHVCLSISLQA